MTREAKTEPFVDTPPASRGLYRRDGMCSRCGRRREGKHRWCRKCKAAYARATRKRWEQMTPDERLRITARSIANRAQRLGKLVPRPCEQAGTSRYSPCSGPVQKYHADYRRPLDVRWLCVAHRIGIRSRARRKLHR